MYPTFFPDDELTVKAVPRDQLVAGDVVAIIGGVVETDNGINQTGQRAVLTHRLLYRDDESVYTTGDFDPTSEWAADPIDAVVGRVVDVAPTVDGWASESIRLLWYWERLVDVACNCVARPVVKRVVPLLTGLVRRAADRVKGDEVSLSSVKMNSTGRDPGTLGETLANCFDRLTDVLDLPEDAETTESMAEKCPLWSNPVSLVSVNDLADSNELTAVIEQGRRKPVPVLPVGEGGTTVYPTIGRTFGITPCSTCNRGARRCRNRESLQFDGESVSSYLQPAIGESV